MGLFGGAKTIVGLDIGSSSIKAVELRKAHGEIEVAHIGVEPLASDIVVDSMIVDSGSVSSAITKIFTENAIKPKAVATSVSGHSVIVKKIPLPTMDDSELANSIQTEAAQHIPFDIADVSVGGNQYTDSLQKELDLSFEDAENLKLGRKVGTVSEDAKMPILQQVTEIIVLEIQKTFDFFRATAAGEHIERIYMAGGSSKVPGLIEALRQEFSLPVEILNPFQRIAPPAGGAAAELIEKNAGQLAVAVGLALRSFEQ